MPLANFRLRSAGAEGKAGAFPMAVAAELPIRCEKAEAFLKLLPRTREAAVRLAKKHDERMKGRMWEREGSGRRLRALFWRSGMSFMVPEFFRAIEEIPGWPLCLRTRRGSGSYAEDLTSDFVYIRLHGDEELYAAADTATRR